jgi:hypothetical protein
VFLNPREGTLIDINLSCVHHDKPSDSKDKREKIGLKLEDEWEAVYIEKVLQEGPSPQCDSLNAIKAYTLANQDMEALKDE